MSGTSEQQLDTRGLQTFDHQPDMSSLIAPDGSSDSMSDFVFYPTFRCNLNCYMCHAVSDRKDKPSRPELTLEQIKSIFDDLEMNNIIHLGGEPFVRKDILDVFDYFDAKGVRQIIVTNGVCLDEQIVERLTLLKHLAFVHVSLNGPKEVDTQIRRTPGAFDKTARGIKLLKQADLTVWMQCVILNESVGKLAETVTLAKELGVDLVDFMFGQITTERDAQATEALLKEWLDEDIAFCGNVGDLTYSEEQLLANMAAARETGQKLGIPVKFIPDLFAENPELYWRGTTLEHKTACNMVLVPPLSVSVGATGDICPCPMIDKSFGNLLDAPLAEIWNSEQLRAFRLNLIENNLMVGCRRCSVCTPAIQ